MKHLGPRSFRAGRRCFHSDGCSLWDDARLRRRGQRVRAPGRSRLTGSPRRRRSPCGRPQRQTRPGSRPHLAAFTKADRDQSHVRRLPGSRHAEQVQAAQEVKSADFDMYQEPESLTSGYVALHGVAPINSYVKNKTLTPASYNFAGLPPAATPSARWARPSTACRSIPTPGPKCSTTSGCSRPPA